MPLPTTLPPEKASCPQMFMNWSSSKLGLGGEASPMFLASRVVSDRQNLTSEERSLACCLSLSFAASKGEEARLERRRWETCLVRPEQVTIILVERQEEKKVQTESLAKLSIRTSVNWVIISLTSDSLASCKILFHQTL